MNTTPAPTVDNSRKPLRGIQTGVVSSDKRDKSRTVIVSYLARHPKYGKFVRRRSTHQVHDEENVSKLGDRVQIARCRPMSKTKRWRLIRVVAAGPQIHENIDPLAKK